MSGLDRLFVPDLAWSGKPWRHYITADRQTCRRSLTAAAATGGLEMEAGKEEEEGRGVWSSGGEVKGHRVCILYGMRSRMKDAWRTQRWNDVCFYLYACVFVLFYLDIFIYINIYIVRQQNTHLRMYFIIHIYWEVGQLGMKRMSAVNKEEVCVWLQHKTEITWKINLFQK